MSHHNQDKAQALRERLGPRLDAMLFEHATQKTYADTVREIREATGITVSETWLSRRVAALKREMEAMAS